MIDMLNENKEKIISALVGYIREKFPYRTTEYEKCKRDLEFIYDAFVFDLQTGSDWYVKNIGSFFWKGDKRQIVSYEVEIQVHKVLAQKLIELLPDRIDYILHLQKCLEEILINGIDQTQVVPYPDMVKKSLQNLAFGRHNYKPLSGSVAADDIDIILEAANGRTPALSNEYNYRINVIPDKYKKELMEKTATYSQAAAELKPGYAVDVNYQYMAPLLLCFSLQENMENKSRFQWCGPITLREPNLIATGICLWHTTLTAESLGYKTSFINITGEKSRIAKDILGLKDPEPDLRTVERDGHKEYVPVCFLAIGSEGTINTNSRPIKQENVVNKLILN